MDIYVDRWRLYWTFVSLAESWLPLLCPMFMRSRAPTGLLVFVGRIVNIFIRMLSLCATKSSNLYFHWPLIIFDWPWSSAVDHYQDDFDPSGTMVLAGIATTAAYKYLNIYQYSISEYISIVVLILFDCVLFQLIKSKLLNGCLFFRRLIPMETRIAKRAEEPGQKSHL